LERILKIPQSFSTETESLRWTWDRERETVTVETEQMKVIVQSAAVVTDRLSVDSVVNVSFPSGRRSNSYKKKTETKYLDSFRSSIATKVSLLKL